jgi:hypothetical protein
MAVLSFTNPAPILPVVNVETDVATITPGAPLDNISVYFVGGQGSPGPLRLRLYAVVGGFRTLVAQTQLMGTPIPSIIDFQTVGRGDSSTDVVDPAGTAYIVTIQDLSATPGQPAKGVTVTLAGVNTFDTAADQDFGALVGPLAPGASQTLPVFGGYAQLMDVAIDQSNLPPVFVTISADCGPGSVQAVVIETAMAGRDDTVQGVFRDLKLPVATRYFATVTNQSQRNLSVVFTAVTHSVAATSGGAVILNGDVIGPSASNTVIKWFGVPLNNAGPGSFTTPPGPTAVPFYNPGLNTWFAFTPSGDVTYTDAGVGTVVAWENVPLDPVSMSAPAVGDIPVFTAGHWVATPPASIPFVVTLSGNANGPSNANDVVDFGIESVNNVPPVTGASFVPGAGLWYVGISGATADIPIALLATMPPGSKVIVKDEDGSLASFDFDVTSVGKTIDGLATFVMDVASPGPFGAVTFEKNFNAPNEWSVVTQ